jgi:hypothetical protein
MKYLHGIHRKFLNVAHLGPVYTPSSKFIWPVVAMISVAVVKK